MKYTVMFFCLFVTGTASADALFGNVGHALREWRAGLITYEKYGPGTGSDPETCKQAVFNHYGNDYCGGVYDRMLEKDPNSTYVKCHKELLRCEKHPRKKRRWFGLGEK